MKIFPKRTTFGWLLFILVAIFSKGTLKHILIGFVFIFIGETIRTLASGIIKKNEILAVEGVYKLCRHPLYFGSFLISLGLSITAKNIFIWIYFIVFFPLLYIPTILKEEKFLKEKFKDEYEKYQNLTPIFFPKFKKVDLKNFSWGKFKENKEYINWIVLVLLGIILLIKTKFPF